MVWSRLKRYIGANNTSFTLAGVEELLNQAIALVTPDNWARDCARAKRLEEEAASGMVQYIDTTLHSSIISLGSDSSNCSDSSVSEMSADLSRYRHVVSCLPPRTASKARDLPLAPPAGNACKTLKDTLVQCLTPSEPERLGQLVSDAVLGDRTPTQLLRHMQRLVGSGTAVDNTILGEIFFQRLPNDVQVALDTVDAKDLGKMA
ncbi:hypothetical protein HPB50_009468 [Hyalomma asiaticum]|uniref:Uncharacterized protein n=1 Tax=Hyalomma asiaticum TaxID=266040 RepID=A0ACB7SMC2_HYAAI|nr:hypothetical protein HPB50_009468 [Hyalomma asiaticum]